MIPVSQRRFVPRGLRRAGIRGHPAWRKKLISNNSAKYCRWVTIVCSRRRPEMRIAILTTDSREHYRDYRNLVTSFGTSPEAFLQGFAQLKDVEVHVVSCARAPMT